MKCIHVHPNLWYMNKKSSIKKKRNWRNCPPPKARWGLVCHSDFWLVTVKVRQWSAFVQSPTPTPRSTTLSSEIESVSLWQAHALKPIHFLKAHVNSYSSTAMEHKYKDKDNYKYKDKDKDGDAKTITGILTVCYIFGILMTRQVQPSTAQYSLEPPCTV